LNKKQPVINYLISFLRDIKTDTLEFRQYSDRIMHLLIEEAISQEMQIDRIDHFSPTGSKYDHYKLKHPIEDFSCVSILRSGDAMVEPM
jgi:uracil phosphoribosyltransferase